jgi:competence protein ComFC
VRTWTNWLNAGLSFLYPEVCQICRDARATPEECYLCAACRARVQFIRKPFCSRCGLPFQAQITGPFECSNCRDTDLAFAFARSAVAARGPVLEIVHGYKYNRAFWFEPLLAEWLIQAARPELALNAWDCIVPVPLHPTRQREREFNQAEHLARRLAHALGVPLEARCILRVRPTESQTRLTREQRRQNMRQAFAPAARGCLDGRRVVLVDDVMTTGATTDACAKALRRAGAAEVCVWTVVRGT